MKKNVIFFVIDSLSLERITGMNFKDYLIQLRMEEAKRLLSSGGISVKDTAKMVGYNNISHFIKTFKRRVGASPSSYTDLSM